MRSALPNRDNPVFARLARVQCCPIRTPQKLLLTVYCAAIGWCPEQGCGEGEGGHNTTPFVAWCVMGSGMHCVRCCIDSSPALRPQCSKSRLLRARKKRKLLKECPWHMNTCKPCEQLSLCQHWRDVNCPSTGGMYSPYGVCGPDAWVHLLHGAWCMVCCVRGAR